LTASGFSTTGLGHIAGLDHLVGDDNIKSDGYLLQGAYTFDKNRMVVTYGESTVENTASTLDATHTNVGLAFFRTLYTGVTFVAEYNKTQAAVTASLIGEKNHTFAVGAVVTF